MEPTPFKKVNYLGEGYTHVFINDATGKQEMFPASAKEYAAMGVVNGEANNPVKEGYTWQTSYQGTVKTDSENGCLNPLEYCDINDKVMITLRRDNGVLAQIQMDKAEFYGTGI